MRSVLAAAAVLLCVAASADTLPRHEPVPGGLAVVTVLSADHPRPEAHFGRERVMVLAAHGHWHAIVGLPAGILPGEYLVRVNTADTEEATTRFRVRPPVPGSRSGGPAQPVSTTPFPPGDDALDSALTVWRNTDSMDLEFRTPVSTRPGDRQAAAADTVLDDVLVTAPSGGIVAGVLPIREQVSAVVLDHGQGLFSILSPLHRVAVTRGATLAKGDRIGTTDFRTSPNRTLDWQVIINRTRIDPHFLLAEPPAVSLLTRG